MRQSTTIDPVRLGGEIAWIEARVAEIDRIPLSPSDDWRKGLKHRRLMIQEYAKLRDRLISRGARITDAPTMMRMRHFGITTTCTAGLHGLLTNWINAAKRRISEADGGR